MEISKYGSFDNQLKYNGKELQTEADLEWYDYGARFYDPVLGRWHSVDPMAEKYFSFSPYEYVGGNPILRMDPDGMDWDVTKDENGNIHFNVTVQVKNTAGIPQEEVESLMNSIKSSFESTFQGTSEDGTTYSSTLNIDWKGEDETSADFNIDFVNKVEGDGALDPFASGKTDEIGNMNTNRMQVQVGHSSEETGITGAHELGHSGGLWDINETEMNNGVDETGAPIHNNNLMIRNVVCQCPGPNRTITNSQLGRISSNYYYGLTVPTSRKRMPIIPTREVQINNDKPQLKSR
jgi:RHS repeat-associated protein